MEDSIERVLLVLKEEQDDSDSMEGDFDGIEEPAPALKVGEFDAVCRDNFANGISRSTIS